MFVLSDCAALAVRR